MSFRPPIQASSLFRGLRCARLELPQAARKASLGVSPAFVRAYQSSSSRLGIFSRSSSSTETPSPTPSASASPTATPPTPAASAEDISPTAYQVRIAELEARASASIENAEAHLALLRALSEGGELKGLAGWYEVVALGVDSSGAAGSARLESGMSKALVGSDEAWKLYVDALARSGRLGEVAARVRRRDELVKGLPAVAAASNGSSAPATVDAAAAVAAVSSSSGTSPAPVSSSTSATPSAPSLLSRILASSKSESTSSTSPSPAIAAAPIGQGTQLSPLYVQMAPPPPRAWAGQTMRWLITTAFWMFIILTVMSLVAENTGLLKASQQPQEYEPEEGKVVKFSDVHGCEEAKAELEEIVEFLRNPDKFSKLGGRLPKGVLLTGPPGTGKTMLARAVAGEAGVPFLFASGSGFEEMYVGVGAKRVRELFSAAKKRAPAIVFIDELDAIGGKRSSKDAHYMKQTLNELLTALDGFEQTEGVIIIAATNFPQSLDSALTRPGRFDRHVVVGLPDVRGRIAILKHHMAEVAFDVSVDASVIARGCPGMSGADLQNLVNQAAIKASREGSSSVQLSHFEWAKDRILMGAERKSHFVTEASKRATAYHEGGHALVAMHTPGAMPLHKVTIMPRGQALGITFQLPEQDKDSYSRKEYSAMIDVALGGRAAEDMIYGKDDVTSGCSSDLQRATDVAARMIRSYGFSDKVGLVAHGDDESIYLSGKKKDEIESEIRAFLDQGLSRAENVLRTHEHELHALANALIEYETLSHDEVRQVLRGEKLGRPGASEGAKLVGEQEKAMGTVVADGI